MNFITIKDLFAHLKEEAQECIDLGNSKEIQYGQGIMYTIEEIEKFCKAHKIVLNK